MDEQVNEYLDAVEKEACNEMRQAEGNWDVVENCDCESVPEGRFGVQCSTGNYFGDFATRRQAQHFIKEQLEEIARLNQITTGQQCPIIERI